MPESPEIPAYVGQVTIPNLRMRVVTFVWSTKHGECHECGLPAAFKTGVYLQDPHPHDVPLEDRRCAVCAANEAVAGETISRIDPEEKT